MLTRTKALAFSSVLLLGCADGPSAAGTEDGPTQGTSTGGNSTTPATSTGQQDTLDPTVPQTTTSGSSTTTSSSSESSSGGPEQDPCPAGVGADWPGRGAFLTLVAREDFPEGPLELPCSIDRSLDSSELELGATAALELTCGVPDQPQTSRLRVAVTLPEAVDRLEALVGLRDVTVAFNHGAGHLKAVWTEAVEFVVRDERGPLILSQWTTCEGELTAPDNACAFFDPPTDVTPTWSAPLPPARLADVGCGTRLFEFNYPPATMGPYEMGRLAMRFETEDGPLDVLDRHQQPLVVDGETYTLFATELLGELDDPAIIYGTSGYTHFLRFFLLREP